MAEQEEAWVSRAVEGDKVALRLLLVNSFERLRERVARRIPADLASHIDPEDIVQEAHIEVFKRLGDFEYRGEGSFDRWLATIALSRLRNAIQHERAAKRGGGLRRAANKPHAFEDSAVALLDLIAGTTESPSRCVARTEAVRALHGALGQLPENQRQAVWMVHIEGRPVREVSHAMGRTERAIHGLCRRGIALLRESLGSSSGYLSSTR